MIEIYGKENCGYCNMAKQLCDSKQLDYVYKNLGEDYSQDQFFAQFPTARTFPQIIFNGEAIGGFNELREKV
jgi:glutaredoxin 3